MIYFRRGRVSEGQNDFPAPSIYLEQIFQIRQGATFGDSVSWSPSEVIQLTNEDWMTETQAGTWDSLLQCLHLDKCLLLTFFDKTQRNDKELKITAHILSWGKLWTTRYKRSKLNRYFWGARNKSRVLHMVPAQSTTKGVGRPPKLPSDLTHMLDPVLTPF